VGHSLYLRPIRVLQPFHPVGVLLLRSNLCSFIGLLVDGDFLVHGAPPDLDGNAGSGLRSALIWFRAWIAYCCQGPGSSDAIRLIAACASVKMVTRSEIVFLLDADSSARARAAGSAS